MAHRAIWPLLVALAVVASGTGWQLAVVAHTPTSATPTSSPSSAGVSTAVTVSGNWVIKTDTTASDETITVQGGVQVDSGATLSLTHVQLYLAEPSPLANGVEVRGGGGLVGNDLTIDSSTPSNPVWVRADANSNFSLTGGSILDAGGPQGPQAGLTLEGSNAFLNGVHFDRYFEAIAVSSAPYVTLTHLFIGNSTTNSNSTYAVSATQGSSYLRLTDSVFHIPQGVGALLVASPYAKVVSNQFTLNPNSGAGAPFHLGYTNNGVDNANYSYVANNTVFGAGIIADVASYVTISGNTIVDTGVNGPYGVRIGVPVGTQPGLWTTGDVVANNYISDWSRYGVRVQLNVTHFVVRGNVIVNPSTNPGPSWTEKWGGPQIDGIYIIRGVNNGTVDHNWIDLTDLPAVASNGIDVESNCNTIRITNNILYNVTQNGLMLQGDVPGFVAMPPWEAGPTFNLFIANNEFLNERPVQQTNFPVKGIIDWLWTNHTTVENNTWVGWQNVDNAFGLNGAIVVTEGSYGTYVNNTIIGAQDGFVFTDYGGAPHPYVGMFNRSYNLVYGNHLYGIVKQAVIETPNDGMGPLHNVINVLDDSPSGGHAPSSYLESIGPVSQLGWSEANGVFTQTFTTPNPITHQTQSFSTTLNWQSPRFSVSSAGTLAGDSSIAWSLNSLNSTRVSYTLPTASGSTETVTVQAPVPQYTALYQVSVGAGKTTNFEVNSSTGPAVFSAGGSSSTTVTVSLLSWQHTGGAPNDTISAIYGSVYNETNQSVGGVLVTVGVGGGGSTTYISTTADADGEFAVENLTLSGNVTSLEVAGGADPLLSFSQTPGGPGTVNLTVWVHATGGVSLGGGGPPGSSNNTTWSVTYIAGTAIDNAGNPVANLTVTLLFAIPAGGATNLSTVTAADGSFEFSGINITGELRAVYANGSGYVFRSYFLNPSPAQLLDLTVWVAYAGVSTLPGSPPQPPSGDPSSSGDLPTPALVAAVAVVLWGVAAIALVRPALAPKVRRTYW
jgi:hypothetical protein